MGWLGRLFPKGSLAGVTKATEVRLRGAVAAGPEVRSSITGRSEPVLVWFFSRRFTKTGSRRSSAPAVDLDAFRFLAAGCFVADWVMVDVGGAILRVPAQGLGVSVASSDLDGQIIDALPPPLAHVPVDPSDYNLRYGERWLSPGDTVVLRARVAPADDAASPYRGGGKSAPRADFESAPGARIVDTIGAQLSVRAGETRRRGVFG